MRPFYGENKSRNRPYLLPGRPGFARQISGWPGFRGLIEFVNLRDVNLFVMQTAVVGPSG